jgi:uncharacterized protein
MADSYIDYDAKVQNALRSVVKTVLKETQEEGLMGDHHFYVAFKTQAEGVSIPAHLVSRFPDEMTIVVQHKYWGLEVHEDHFEIGLSFNQKPETLVIPFKAIVGFVDPSVQFALQFNDENDDDLEDFADMTDVEDLSQNQSFQPKAKTAAAAKPTAVAEPSEGTGGDNIVTLDAFRRK